MIINMFGHDFSVPPGLSTKETVQYVKDVIKGVREEYVEPINVTVDGTLDKLPSPESKTE
jgi:hypothetical protein